MIKLPKPLGGGGWLELSLCAAASRSDPLPRLSDAAELV